MTKTEKAVQLACEMANNDKYGYDQGSRWGPDFDCSSFLIYVWEKVGVPVKTKGASYTGNMRGVFLRCGFQDVTAHVNLSSGTGILPGDILLNIVHHVAMYIGNGKLVQASINEKGSVIGGRTGDQTGREISERHYYNYPWDCVLRFSENTQSETIQKPSVIEKKIQAAKTYRIEVPLLKYGDRNNSVVAMQGILIAKGYSCGASGADGNFGRETEYAVKRFQKEHGLEDDGECGEKTWTVLLWRC